MRKSDFIGWRQVFAFTFSQTVKQKAFGIFLVVFSIIALLYSPVMALVNQYGDQKESKVVISEVVVFDETGLEIDYTNVFSSKKYQNIKVVSNPTKTLEDYEKQMEETADDTMLIKVNFDKEEKRYHALFIQGKNVSLSELAKVEFTDEFCDFFDEAKMAAVNVTKEQKDIINTKIVREVNILEETGGIVDKVVDSISYNDYFITLILLMVCMMLINMSGNQIALSIATEKSSRVIEYLALNVRPLALIVGKLLATIVTSSLQMITVGFCYAASPIVSNMITPTLSKWIFGTIETAESSAELADETLAATVQMIYGIKIEYVLFALLYVILGIVFYGIIAGLLGASVSKMDEMQESMTMFQLLLIFGCYADLALCVMQIAEKGSPVLSGILNVCPVTAPFLAPCSMLLGRMSWPLIIASFAVMLLSIALLFALTANVYEAMIFYNGKALKIKDILELASSKKKTIEKEEVKNEK